MVRHLTQEPLKWLGSMRGPGPSVHRSAEAAETEALAAAWLIRLEEDTSAATWAQWRRWLGEDSRRQAVYIRIESRWRQSDILRKLRPLDGSVDPDVLTTFPGLQPPAEARSSATFRPRIAHLALAAAVAISTMVLATWFHSPKPDPELRQTELGGFERAVLSDGSTVLLNTNSEIRVRFGRESREIALIRGEALFTVAPEARPFSVVAGGNIVRALGTSFAVRLRSNSQAEVIVARGRVSVAQGARTPRLMLTAGDDATLDAQGPAATGRLDANDIDHRLAWTRGQIWLNQNTLAEAVAEFNRYNSRRFVLADPALATLRVGGSFAATDPEAFIAALQRVFGVRALSMEDISGAPVIRLIGPAS